MTWEGTLAIAPPHTLWIWIFCTNSSTLHIVTYFIDFILHVLTEKMGALSRLKRGMLALAWGTKGLNWEGGGAQKYTCSTFQCFLAASNPLITCHYHPYIFIEQSNTRSFEILSRTGIGVEMRLPEPHAATWWRYGVEMMIDHPTAMSSGGTDAQPQPSGSTVCLVFISVQPIIKDMSQCFHDISWNNWGASGRHITIWRDAV